jgi:hypothetical protein
MRPSARQRALLIALLDGYSLKVHRTVDGEKIYRLHSPNGIGAETALDYVVTSLEQQGLIISNMKFPAATYMLTDRGVELAASFTHASHLPAGPRNYH